MFTLIDPPIYEQPIEIDFNEWLRQRGEAIVPTLDVRVTIIATEWVEEDDKPKWQVPSRYVFNIGKDQAFGKRAEAASYLQGTWFLPHTGKDRDQNAWDALLAWAMFEAIDWRTKETRTEHGA